MVANEAEKIYRKRFMGAMRFDVAIATVAINFLGLALPIVILQLYDRIIPQNATITLAVLVAILAVVIVLEAILRYCRQFLLDHLGSKFEQQVTDKLFKLILQSDYSNFSSRRHSDYLEKLKAIQNVKEAYFGPNILAVIDLPFVVLFLCLIGYFTGWLVFIPLLLATAYGIYSIGISRSLYEDLTKKDTVEEQKHNFLLELLHGMQAIKALGMEASLLRRYERLQEKSATNIYNLTYHNHMVQSSTTAFTQFMMIAFVSCGALLVIQGQFTMGSLAAGSMLVGRLLIPASRALNFWAQWQTAKVSEEKLSSLTSLEQEKKYYVDAPAHPRSLTGPIEFNDVKFCRGKGQEVILSNINLTVDKDSIVAIKGDNGSGKTTLAKLILGLLHPSEGVIKFNGVDQNIIDLDTLGKRIAYIPQYGSLFNGTVLENLTLFHGKSLIQQSIDYSQKLGIDSVVARMSDGLATQMDSTLIETIPLGFRQRIALVRAMVGEPSIVVFDDADSGYDPENHKALCRFFKSLKGQYTVVLITNNGDLHSIADRSYQIREKTIEPVCKKTYLDRLANVSLCGQGGEKIKVQGGRYNA